ncbi:MAG: phosphoribosylanthranilate isomerase [Gammaproteobacteria bacterium]|nr:phosphoribosylanthranilate isomerase [Gammaproteobacteria bacterium]
MRTRVKICGLTRIDDVRTVVAAGADAIGLNFDPASPRAVTAEQARSLAAVVPPFITVVGLFVNADTDAIREVLNRVPLSLIQFHGSETPEQCRQFARPYIKAIPMRDLVDLPAAAKRYDDAVGLLLDTFAADKAGGTGRTFDWARIPTGLAKPIILAGGLTPENVADAIARVHPAAVDVSSGVESAKGIKDANKIAAFIQAVRETT